MFSLFALVAALSVTPQPGFSEALYTLAGEAATRTLTSQERALVAGDRLAALRYLRVVARKPGAQEPLELPPKTHALLPALNALVTFADRDELSDETMLALYEQHGLYLEDALAIVTPTSHPALGSLMAADRMVAGRSRVGAYLRGSLPSDPKAFIERACQMPFSDELVLAFLERGEPAFSAFVSVVEGWENDSARQAVQYWDGCFKAGVSAMLGSDPRVLELPREKLDPRRFVVGFFDRYAAAVDAGRTFVPWYAATRDLYFLAWSGDFGSTPPHNRSAPSLNSPR